MTIISPGRNSRRSPGVMLPMIAITLCLLTLASATRALAATDGPSWQPVGPNSGATGAILVHPMDPSRIFIVSREGVSRSDDGGEHWRMLYIQKGASGRLGQIVLHPTDPDTLYALFLLGRDYPYNTGVFVTHDGGETWLHQFSPPRPEGYDNILYSALALAPSTPEILYLFANQWLYKSDDGGETWTRLNISGHAITSIAVSPSDAHRVYAATARTLHSPAGILRSEDGGKQWISLEHPDEWEAESLTIHPTDPDTLFIGITDGLFVSHDGGLSWTKTGLELWRPSDISINSTNPAIMYAAAMGSTYKSEDGGANWRVIDDTILDTDIQWTDHIAIHPADPETIFINRSRYYEFPGFYGSGFTGKFYKSADGGDHWRLLGQGLPYNAAYDFTISPQTGAIYVASGAGMFRHDINSQIWTPINNGLGEIPPVTYQVAISPGTPETLYIVTQPANDDALAIYQSQNEGETWSLNGMATGGALPGDLVIAPTSPPSLYLVDGQGKIEKSQDGGVTWTVLDAGPERTGKIAIDPTDPNRLYASDILDSSSPLRRSLNGGLQWEKLPLPDGPVSNITLELLAVDPGGGIYTQQNAAELKVRDGPLLRSDDHGESWEALDALPLRSHLYDIAFDPADPTRIIIAADDGVSVSWDRGRSWMTAGQPLSTRYPASQAAINPTDPQRLAIMTWWSGPYEREFVIQKAYLPLLNAMDDGSDGGPIDPARSGAWVQSSRLDPDGDSGVAVQPRQLVTGLTDVQYWRGTEEETDPDRFAVAVILAVGDRMIDCLVFPHFDRAVPMLTFPGQSEEYDFTFVAPEQSGRYNLTASAITGEFNPSTSPLCPQEDDWQAALPPNATRVIGEVVVQE